MKTVLCQAVRDVIRSVLNYKNSECEEMPSGRPMPSSSGVFIAVHEGGVHSSARGSLDETYGVQVTVTIRLTVAWDRAGPMLLLKEQKGLEFKCKELINLLHMNYDVLNAANQYLAQGAQPRPATSGVIYGFSEPLGFEGDGGEAREVGPDWFWSSNISTKGHAPCGYSQVLSFGGARRLQSLGSLQ